MSTQRALHVDRDPSEQPALNTVEGRVVRARRLDLGDFGARDLQRPEAARISAAASGIGDRRRTCEQGTAGAALAIDDALDE